MDEAAAIQMIVEHLKGLFPKTCPNCQRQFASLRDFYLNTTPVGEPISYDLASGDVRPAQPMGAVAASACRCGASIALTSDGMPLFRYWSLLLWVKNEAIQSGQTTAKILNSLRKRVREQVISESGALESIRGAAGLSPQAHPGNQAEPTEVP